MAFPQSGHLNWPVSMGRGRDFKPRLEKRQESGERGPSCVGLAYFTTISFCEEEWGERKKREIAFSNFLFLHFCWAFLNLTFLKCQELLVPIKYKVPDE